MNQTLCLYGILVLKYCIQTPFASRVKFTPVQRAARSYEPYHPLKMTEMMHYADLMQGGGFHTQWTHNELVLEELPAWKLSTSIGQGK